MPKMPNSVSKYYSKKAPRIPQRIIDRFEASGKNKTSPMAKIIGLQYKLGRRTMFSKSQTGCPWGGGSCKTRILFFE
jgi:hypothetical protein